MSHRWLLLTAVSLALTVFSVACERGIHEPAIVDNSVTEDDNVLPMDPALEDETFAVTYHRDVRPIIESKCMDCHVAGGIAPEAYDFSDPAKVKTLAPVIMSAVETGRMPPWLAQDGCNDYVADVSLQTEELEMIRAWSNDGAPLGKASEFTPKPSPLAELNLERLAPEPDLELRTDAPFEPDYSLKDDYRCFVIDPGFETTRYMEAFAINVDNDKLLHHVVMFTVPGDERTLDELNALEAEDDKPGYQCYGGPRTSETGVGLAWAPGAGHLIMPDNVGMPMDAGTRFIVQMHYNTVEGTGTDHSAVQMWLMEEDTKPAINARMQFFGNLPFEVPPGVNGLDVPDEECDRTHIMMGEFSSAFGLVKPPEGSVNARDLFRDASRWDEVGKSGCITMDFMYALPIPINIFGIGPHMHEVGKKIKVEVVPLEEQEDYSVFQDDSQCLVDVPAWDFNWQRGYGFKEDVTLPRKGSIRLTCRYDTRLKDEPTRLGEGTGDEMCLALISILSPI